MSDQENHKTVGELQLDQFLKGLESEEGRKKIGDDAYKEAKDAEKRKSITPNSSK